MDLCHFDFVIVFSLQIHLRLPSDKGFVPPRWLWRINFAWVYNFSLTLEKDVNSIFVFQKRHFQPLHYSQISEESGYFSITIVLFSHYLSLSNHYSFITCPSRLRSVPRKYLIANKAGLYFAR